jgi:hypothetical protein
MRALFFMNDGQKEKNKRYIGKSTDFSTGKVLSFWVKSLRRLHRNGAEN